MKWLKTEKTVFVSASCQGEKCLCGEDAVRKIGEEIPSDDPNPVRHNFTAYVCAECYANVLGVVAAEDVGLKLNPDYEEGDDSVGLSSKGLGELFLRRRDNIKLPPTPAEYMTDVLQMKIDDLPENELDMPVIEGEDLKAAYVKFMSDGGDHDEVMADRFEAVLEDLNATYIRTTPRVITGDFSGLTALAAEWKKEA